ncbi:MAG: RNA polymerase sigma factor [Terriglobales bacterium]|jgi:RNA polymerase sigma factor (sigma-70 family)
MSAGPKIAEEKQEPWGEERLVRECRKGSEEAWSALIDRYKNLIYSIPIKYGFNQEDASEIFQSVSFEILQQLPKLREPKALPKWIIQITSHKCFQWHRQQSRFVSSEGDYHDAGTASQQDTADQLLLEAEEEQALRDAIGSLSPRCRELIGLLFYEAPARPYNEVAAQLGIAMGSIGFIRGRCLEKLRVALQKAGIK